MDSVELIKAKGSKRLLKTLQEFPERTFSIRELAIVSSVPFSNAWRIVKKWEQAGIVYTGRLGPSVTVKWRPSAYANHVAHLAAYVTSPQAFTVERLKEKLRKLPKVKAAYLFGSVARSEEKLESDIDVALLAEKGFDSTNLAIEVIDEFGTKLMPLDFYEEAELNEFLQGKKAVKIK